MNAALELVDVSVTFATRYGQVQALRGVSLDVAQGDVLVMVGESGSGKSVLAHTLTGMLPSNAIIHGTVRIDRHDLYRHTEAQRNKVRADHIAVIPQSAATALNPVRRLEDQLVATAQYRGMARDVAAERVTQRLDALGLDWTTLRRRYSHQLSGGMQQRVVTVFATIGDPELVIADEPTNGLDADLVAATAAMLRTHVDRGATLLVITHDLRLAHRLGGRVGVLYGATLVELGATEDVLARPAHPYTQGLVGALPERGGAPIPGMPVQLDRLPAGCTFVDRCAYAEAACHDAPPSGQPVGRGTAWCINVARAQQQAPCHD